MDVSTEIVLSDDHLVRYGQAWSGVPMILVDGLLAMEQSAWLLDLRIRGCSPHTLTSYAKTLALWLKALAANDLHWRHIGSGAAERFSAMLTREGCATGTVRLRMFHIQEFYRWARVKGHIKTLPFHLQQRWRPIKESGRLTAREARKQNS